MNLEEGGGRGSLAWVDSTRNGLMGKGQSSGPGAQGREQGGGLASPLLASCGDQADVARPSLYRWGPVSVSCGYHSNSHKLGSLKQQK